jgi:hypothetical protein
VLLVLSKIDYQSMRWFLAINLKLAIVHVEIHRAARFELSVDAGVGMYNINEIPVKYEHEIDRLT